jgi:hypothetical protein
MQVFAQGDQPAAASIPAQWPPSAAAGDEFVRRACRANLLCGKAVDIIPSHKKVSS